MRDALFALKYRGVRGVARPLGALAAAAIEELPSDCAVVSVPPHPRRLRQRGLDHAGLLARTVADTVGRPFRDGLLRRTRDTPPQVGLPRPARRTNVRGAFRATRAIASLPVLVVDDVMTTGATVGECARALLHAGAATVDVCTVARADIP